MIFFSRSFPQRGPQRGLWTARAVVFLVFAALTLSGALSSPSALAKKKKTAAGENPFTGVEITLAPGAYKLLANANVRSKPSLKGRRIGGLRKGEIVTGVSVTVDKNGKKWLAVQKKGRYLGFISFNAAKRESKVEVRAEAQTVAKPEAKPELAVKLKAKPAVKLKAEAKPAVKPKPKAKSEVQANPFAGVKITAAPSPYEVTSNVNVRDKPSITGKRLGGLIKGEKITAIGSAVDETGRKWLAVKKAGKDLGFITFSAAELIIAVKADFSVNLAPGAGIYLANKDVAVRASPDTDSARITRLKKGARIEAIGKTEDAAWLAVKQGDKKLGYVFAPYLLPLVNGYLNEDIKGGFSAPGKRKCKYVISFDEKNTAPEEAAGTFDYDIAYNCKKGAVKFKFFAFMFITEAPFDMTRSKVYQINVDVLDIGDRFDEVLSVTFMYDKKKSFVTFDGVSQKPFAGEPSIKGKKALSVKDALKAAVEIAAGAWKFNVWEVLASDKRWPQEAAKARARAQAQAQKGKR